MNDFEWLAALFEYEYCAECGGDAVDHTVVRVMGNPFARCDFPPDADGTWAANVAAFRDRPPREGRRRQT